MADYTFLVPFLVAVAILFFIAIRYMIKNYQFLKKYAKNIPVAPLLGWSNFLNMEKFMDDFLPWVHNNMIKLKTDYFIWYNFYFPLYCTANADDFEIILPSVLERGIVYTFISDINESILTEKNPLWKPNRKIISKCFKQQTLNKMIPSLNESITNFINTYSDCELASQIANKNSRFFMNLFIRHFSKGHPEDDESVDLYGPIKAFTHTPYERFTKFWLFPHFTYKFSNLKRKADKLHEALNGFITEGIKTMRQRRMQNEVDDEYDNVVEALTKAKVDSERVLNEYKFLAGAATDTNGFTFTMTLLALGIYPEIQEKVFQEAMEVLGSCDQVTQNDLPNLKYTEMVISETLRLFPAVPFLNRKTSEITVLGNDRILPKDLEIILCVHSLQRNEKYWENPLEYNPDRFLPEEIKKRHPFAFAPFSAGPRNCLGYKFAMIVLPILTALFVRKYKIECNRKSIHDIKLNTYITQQITDPTLRCTFTPRNFTD